MNPKISIRMKSTGKSLLYFLIALFLTTSCAKEKDESLINPSAPECCDVEHLGSFNLMPSSRESIPYQEDVNLIFKNEFNNEVLFAFRNGLYGYDSTDNSTSQECPCNPAFNQTMKAKGDTYSYLLAEPQGTLNVRFYISLSVRMFHGEENLIADILDVSLSEEQDTSSYGGLYTLLVDRRNLSDDYVKWYNTMPADSVEMLGKTFYNVYSDEEGIAWYNYDKGLVAFKDRENKLWVFDRIEELK